ncbi:NADPH-dependent F420 reductase [Micromonospora coerulea]|uniref:NADPH-dependent F420 reductase n=1 Tax=Micromonospora coerulea TaxID=47856 RepID=UPI0019053402|nr:NAD(P)-binding domain-containing protein [Micromonospora veneta]
MRTFAWRSASARARAYAGHSDGGSGSGSTSTYGYRFAKGGHDVILGSRSEERAVDAAAVLDERVSGAGSVRGATNADAAETADLVLLAVPYDGHDDLVATLAPQLGGKVVISCVNPLGFDKRGPYGLDLGPTSAAESAQALLPSSHVVGASTTSQRRRSSVRQTCSTTRTSSCVATTPRPSSG